MTETINRPTRLGLHYFPDTTHYREQDLKTWLPELQALGISWLTILSPLERAIPEAFFQGIRQAGIEPVVHLPVLIDQKSKDQQLLVLFENYARWGVKYLAVYDRPNLRRSWVPSAWTQADLVEHFLDQFIPTANVILETGMCPIFPPLEPGGDYWDTAFLQSALRSLLRRGQQALVQSMVLGVNAWTFDRPLDWGKGGPECWPSSQPYYTPEGSQDQIGFRIFDWYQAIAQTETGQPCPLILMSAGSQLSRAGLAASLETTQTTGNPIPPALRQHAESNLAIAQLLAKNSEAKSKPSIFDRNHLLSSQRSAEADPVDHILSINLWLLSADVESKDVTSAWYQPDGSCLPVVNALKQWTSQTKLAPGGLAKNLDHAGREGSGLYTHPIEHYLLLPLYAWGVADWDLEAIRPFLQQYHPTVGFSVYEARLASRVTVFGDLANLSQDTLTILQTAGCAIDCIGQDGTLLAI